MTRDEASALAAELNAEHPQRDHFRWGAREERGGEWAVARVRLPRAVGTAGLTPELQGKAQTPPDQDQLYLPGGLPPWAVGPS